MWLALPVQLERELLVQQVRGQQALLLAQELLAQHLLRA
jgi:hypothetical protein